MSNTNTTIPYVIKTNGSVTLYLKGECLTVAPDHPNYNKIIADIKAGDFSRIENLVNVAKAVTQYANAAVGASGKVRIENGQIFFGSYALHNTLTERIIKMMNEGFKFDHMMKFLENLMQNPSSRAVEETYWFLENFGLPITDDGCFLAYKAVNGNYKDIYSGKFDNSIGAVVSMPRNMVDDNYGVDCSKGLHVGALDYVVGYGHFVKGQAPAAGGNKLLIVKVNPKDVVSVPKYEGHTKMRVCEYTVVSEIKDVVKELDKVVYNSKAEEIQSDWDDSDDNDDDYDNDDCDDCDDSSCDCNSSQTIDTTSPWNEAAYREGWNVGLLDLDNGESYGTGRDYTRENSYRMGYNDAYNRRENQADVMLENESTDEEDYRSGYDCGREDRMTGNDYNSGEGSSEAFVDGYSDGYNDV